MERKFKATRIIVFDMTLKFKISNTNAYYLEFSDSQSIMETKRRKSIMEQHDTL